MPIETRRASDALRVLGRQSVKIDYGVETTITNWTGTVKGNLRQTSQCNVTTVGMITSVVSCRSNFLCPSLASFRFRLTPPRSITAFPAVSGVLSCAEKIPSQADPMNTAGIRSNMIC